MNQQRLDSLLDAFPERSIGLIGDLFLGRYLELTADVEYSIETELEAYQIHRVRNAPGALGTVMNNLAALGVKRLLPVTVIGEDGHGFDLRQSLSNLPIDPQHIVCDPDRLTPTYTKPMRPVDGHWRELNRLDVRSRTPISRLTEAALIEHLRAAWNAVDGLIVLDQIADAECGVVTSNVRAELSQLAKQQPEKWMVVDSRRFLANFVAGDLKGNRSEILGCVGRSSDSTLKESEWIQVLTEFHQRRGQRVFCTDGPEGIWVSDESGVRRIAGRHVAGPIDIVGAGDTVTATLAATLLSGASANEACEVANAAASISIQKLGQTGVATPDELRCSWPSTG